MTWLTVADAAAELGLARKSVYDLISAGVLPCRRVGLKGGKIVLDPDDVKAYWDSCKSKPRAAEAKSALRHIRPPSPSRRPS